MARAWKLVSWIGLGCLGALGCQDTPKRALIVPPKDEFHVPPEGLFSGPVKYPDDLLNTVSPRRSKDDDKLPPPGMGGGMSGANNMGMGRP